MLSVQLQEASEVTMSPPFYLSYERIAQESGAISKNAPYNLTSEMRNQILAAPPIITYLYSALKNKTAKEMSGNTKRFVLVEYTLRFHFGAAPGQANLVIIHGAFTVQYGFPFTTQYIVNQLEDDFMIILVTILAVHMLNTCIMYAPYNGESQSLEKTMKLIQEASILFNGAFQIMESSVSMTIPVSTIYHLRTVKYVDFF